MTQVTMIEAPEVTRRKKALEAKLAELAGTSPHREELQIEYLADPLDQIKSNSDRELALQQVDRQSRLVQDIEYALEAIDQGSYGICSDCEEPIPQKRLNAVPWARLCVPCQSRLEAAGRDAEAVFSDAA